MSIVSAGRTAIAMEDQEWLARSIVSSLHQEFANIGWVGLEFRKSILLLAHQTINVAIEALVQSCIASITRANLPCWPIPGCVVPQQAPAISPNIAQEAALYVPLTNIRQALLSAEMPCMVRMGLHVTWPNFAVELLPYVQTMALQPMEPHVVRKMEYVTPRSAVLGLQLHAPQIAMPRAPWFVVPQS